MEEHCMTKENATKFKLDFVDTVIGKPISKFDIFSKYIITDISVIEMSPSCFQVELVAEDEEEHSEHKQYLINYLIEFEIPFRGSEYGLIDK